MEIVGVIFVLLTNPDTVKVTQEVEAGVLAHLIPQATSVVHTNVRFITIWNTQAKVISHSREKEK